MYKTQINSICTTSCRSNLVPDLFYGIFFSNEYSIKTNPIRNLLNDNWERKSRELGAHITLFPLNELEKKKTESDKMCASQVCSYLPIR